MCIRLGINLGSPDHPRPSSEKLSCVSIFTTNCPIMVFSCSFPLSLFCLSHSGVYEEIPFHTFTSCFGGQGTRNKACCKPWCFFFLLLLRRRRCSYFLVGDSMVVRNFRMEYSFTWLRDYDCFCDDYRQGYVSYALYVCMLVFVDTLLESSQQAQRNP